MRFVPIIMLVFPGAALAEGGPESFDAVRDIFETRCLECHTPEKSQG